MEQFKNPQQQAQFEEKGCVIHQLMTDAEVVYLRELFNQLNPKVEIPFYASIDSPDGEYRKRVNDEIKQIFSPDRLSQLLNGYKPFYGNFIVKNAHKDSGIYLHADWSIMKEDGIEPIIVWTPLVDTDSQNGAICVVEGSHKVTNKVRGPGVVENYTALYPYLEEKYLKQVPLKAGHSVFFHGRLIHSSFPNLTNQARPAIILALLHEQSETVFYHREKNMPVNKAEVYAIDEDFFLSYKNGQRPTHYPKIGEIEYADSVSLDTFKQRYP